MIVSWNWLKQYVPLDMPPEELERRLMMAGLNHESTAAVGDDLAIDLEVTSNRPDCLGHMGIAREIGRALGRAAEDARRAAGGGQTRRSTSWSSVRIDCPDLCPRYTARVIRGVKVGPSPRWLTERLETVGHRGDQQRGRYFQLRADGVRPAAAHVRLSAKLHGPEIIVRRPRPGETIEAIDHKTYALEPDDVRDLPTPECRWPSAA